MYSVWVGGLKGVVQERDLHEKFSPYGRVRHITILRDPETKKSRHCGFVVFGGEQEAEDAASKVNGTIIHGGQITARGPQEQRSRNKSGQYIGRIGHVPSFSGDDKRKYTDCVHYITSSCNNGSECPYRHSVVARDATVPVCSRWKISNCTNVYCPHKHPGKKYHSLATASSDPVIPIYSLSIHDQKDDDVIKLASFSEFDQIKRKFKQDWAEAKGIAPDVKAVFIITNETLKTKWMIYRRSLPLQGVEEHYHGTKLLCDITSNKDLCCSYSCSTCQIVDSGFSTSKIGTNISRFQRFGRGFYLAPNSSKCHDYTEGAYNLRALIVCDVCPGRKYPMTTNDTSRNGPPAGYDSIHGKTGGSLNYEEIVLPKPDAILPKYIVVYQKDGTRKLIE